jgi:hypothetical protein
MAHALYKAVVTEQNYHYTTYTCWVSAASKNSAMVMAGALAGQEKMRREHERTGRNLWPEGLMAPEIRLETVGTDEYYANEGTVEVRD